MISRAGFLKRLALGAGGLIVGEQVLEELARLGHVRKSFPGAGIPHHTTLHGLSESTYAQWNTPEMDRLIVSPGVYNLSDGADGHVSAARRIVAGRHH